jgi:hypothetical protein
MERAYQMHVAPDVLPVLHPKVDLHVKFSPPPSESSPRQARAKGLGEVEPGIFLLPHQVRHQFLLLFLLRAPAAFNVHSWLLSRPYHRLR